MNKIAFQLGMQIKSAAPKVPPSFWKQLMHSIFGGVEGVASKMKPTFNAPMAGKVLTHPRVTGAAKAVATGAGIGGAGTGIAYGANALYNLGQRNTVTQAAERTQGAYRGQ